MKKICLALLLTLFCGMLPSYAADSNTILKFQSAFKSEQGKDNWYYYEFGSEAKELTWDQSKSFWNSSGASPYVKDNDLAPTETKDVGYRFKSPEKGMILITGTVSMPYEASRPSDGVVAEIKKGNKVLWSQTVKYGTPVSYEVKTSIRKGENLDFVIGKGKTLAFDWARWWPCVEYLGEEYVPDGEAYLYFQKNGEEMKQLSLNSDKDGYYADDGMAFADSMYVMPDENYSIVKRLVIPESGRYKALCQLEKGNLRSGGNIVRVYKNGEMVWEQYCTELDKNVVDVGIYCEKDDTVDVEVAVDKYTGYNAVEWICEITKYIGTVFSTATSSSGYLYSTESEISLQSLIGSTQGTNGVTYFSVKNHKSYPMEYNSSTQKWTAPFDGEVGYISMNEICPGKRSDTGMEWTAGEDGILHFDGMFSISSEGVLIKLYQNDKLIWSNRVGGERAVRWDEPYDVSYFNNNMSVFADVKSGDRFKLIFNQWKKVSGDSVGISDIKIKSVSGDVLSETTKWKLKNSILVDTNRKLLIKNGIAQSADIAFENGVLYLSEQDFAELYSDKKTTGKALNGKMYYPLREEAEGHSDNVVWAANSLAIVHKGLPTLYGFTELSEIGIAAKGGLSYE